jgi:drug/metabolite transporter (DMT)-like permease
MNWLAFAFIGAVLSAVWSLSVKKGLHNVFATDFASGYVMISALILTLYNLIKLGVKSFKPDGWGIGSGICQAIAGIALTLSFKASPNPGLTMSVFRTQAILTAVLSYFVFGAPITLPKIIAMIVVASGVYFVSKEKPSDSHETKESFTIKNTEQHLTKFGHKLTEKVKKSWLLLAIVAGVSMSLKDIFTKKALIRTPKNLFGILWNAIFVQSLAMIIYDRYTTGSFGWKDENGDGTVDLKDKLIIVWTGAIFMLYVTTVIKATQLAPNVGYAKAVDTFGVIITTIVAHFLFKAPITKDSIAGILLIVSGISYISLGK